jgi:hypothetical protein
MDYAIRILLEEKVNIEEELKIIDKQERREPQEIRLISIANALNKLNIDDVSKSCFNCNGWGYTLLPNGRRDKTCEVCK